MKKEKETYDFMSDVRSTVKGLLERARCGGRIGEGKVIMTIAVDFLEEESFYSSEGSANEVAATMAMFIKKLNLKEKVDRAYEHIMKHR